jgi:hypothetical protein
MDAAYRVCHEKQLEGLLSIVNTVVFLTPENRKEKRKEVNRELENKSSNQPLKYLFKSCRH